MQFHRLRRREFITLLGGMAATWPLNSRAQQAAMPVVGVLGSASPAPFLIDALLEGLKERGFVDGQNVRIEQRWANNVLEHLPKLAAELVGLQVAALATFGTPAGRVIKDASAKAAPPIPVVFAMGSDPVAEGLVASLNRPGGNMTGVTSITGVLVPKRMELVSEFLRGKAFAFLMNPDNPLNQQERRGAEDASRALGQRLEVLMASNDREIEAAFATLKQRPAGALIIGTDQFYFARMRELATLATQHGIPAIGTLREFAVEGGLMSYGTNITETNRQAGFYVARVLKGERPADLPVLQPTKFELVLNLKAARALAIEISPKLLALADEVIE